MVDQYFLHNLNSWISQVSASGNSLVPMPPTPSIPPPIPPFVITDSSTAGQYFGCQGTRQQRSYNSISSVSINGRPYNGPIYNDKIKLSLLTPCSDSSNTNCVCTMTFNKARQLTYSYACFPQISNYLHAPSTKIRILLPSVPFWGVNEIRV